MENFISTLGWIWCQWQLQEMAGEALELVSGGKMENFKNLLVGPTDI